MAENDVIGIDGRLPWHLPADLRRFKQLTVGHPVIMGRRTFDSIDRKPLADRQNIVLTRDPTYRAPGAHTAASLEDALRQAGDAAEVFVAGGEAVYRAALPIADRLYLTIVHARVEGDTRFPAFDESDWRVIEDERHDADARHAHPFTFRTFERRSRRV